MKASIWKAVAAIRSSYWFLPSVMAFLAIVLGAAAVYVDAGYELEWLDKLGWYQAAKAAGAREVLSIAGSMITWPAWCLNHHRRPLLCLQPVRSARADQLQERSW